MNTLQPVNKGRCREIREAAFLYLFLFQITQLKIDHNPFAKGFRETGAGKSAKK